MRCLGVQALLLLALMYAGCLCAEQTDTQVCNEGDAGPHCRGKLEAGEVLELDPYGLEDFVAKHPAVVAAFCAASAGKCKLLVPELAAAAKSTQEGARFVTVDADQHAEARVIYGIETYPTIRFFVNGRMADEYEGKRLAADIVAAADTQAVAAQQARGGADERTSAVVELTASSFKAMTHDGSLNLLVLFYGAEGCGGAETALEREYEAVARTFEPFANVSVARINAQEFPATFDERYRHLGLPAILFYGQADRFFGFKPREVVYADLRAAGAMVRFLNRKCGMRLSLARLPGISTDDTDTMPRDGDRDAPAWVFAPASSQPRGGP